MDIISWHFFAIESYMKWILHSVPFIFFFNIWGLRLSIILSLSPWKPCFLAPKCVTILKFWNSNHVSRQIKKSGRPSQFPTMFCDTHGLSWDIVFIVPESDHWLCLSLTPSLPNSLTHSYLVNLIDVTLACEDANSKLVNVVTIADEDRVGNNLLQISKLRFGQKTKLLFRLWAQGLVKILKL